MHTTNSSQDDFSVQQRAASHSYLKFWVIFFWALAVVAAGGQLAGLIPFSLADTRVNPWINNPFFFWLVLVLLPLVIGIGFWRMKKWSVVPYVLFCGLWLMLQLLIGGINLIFMGFDATLLAIGLNMVSLWRSNQLA